MENDKAKAHKYKNATNPDERGRKEVDEMFMRRCLQLARNGQLNAKPNPMVGAVIVAPDHRIIGEGYHVRCGEGHAEVNAFDSVKPCDEHLLPESTVYVSLEPCAHHGKTPPCASLIIKKRAKRVVVGCIDPFAKVQGRGIKMLREAGIEVSVGVLERECLELNRKFIIYNTRKRPYIILKWAQTANGYIDKQGKALQISSPFTKMLVHKLRAENDAIAVGRITDEREHPTLNVRYWHGKSPKRIVLRGGMNMGDLMNALHEENIQSILVEGGKITHERLMEANLWDEIRVETAPISVNEGTPAPKLPTEANLVETRTFDDRVIHIYHRTI